MIMLLLMFCSLGAGCAPDRNIDRNLNSITRPYRYSIVSWEIKTFGEEIRNIFGKRPKKAGGGASEVTGYFAKAARINSLVPEIEAIKAGSRQGDLASLEAELSKLQQQNEAAVAAVEIILSTQVREALSRQGIFNPLDKHVGLKVGFPPVYFKLGKMPHLLVVSPRERIESMREVTLLPDMVPEDMESIEDKIDALGVSSLVVELGGFSTYPSLITDKGNLRFTLDSVAEEWLHQYLVFKPLGFRYFLDLAGIRRNYEIATMNETLASMASKEITAAIYESHYTEDETDSTRPEETEPEFDFNREMREIRRAVDKYLARGEVEQAEEFMEQKRQYLAARGYHIRKLNQAYFAFHGAYADRPTSVSPIGVEMKKLRSRSASLKEFLETAAAMTSRQDLAESVR